MHRHLSRETLRAVLILAACPWTDIPGWSATVGTHHTGELGSFPDEFLSYQSDEGLDDVSFALDAPEPGPDTGSGVRRER